MTEIRRFKIAMKKMYPIIAVSVMGPSFVVVFNGLGRASSYSSGNASLYSVIIPIVVFFGLIGTFLWLLALYRKYSGIEVNSDCIVLFGPFNSEKKIMWAEIIRVSATSKNGWALVTNLTHMQIDFRLYESGSELAELMTSYIPSHVKTPSTQN